MPPAVKPYIGARDFYPEDMAFRNWMFSVQRGVCQKYGYGEYAAPIIEPVSLYQVKSSEEIVSDQLYRFVDRGDREIAIRPEMTPTLARMVATRLSDARPLRWFSIANFMRYERPGRGRLREFFQLNVDLLGSTAAAADVEIIGMAADILLAYGAKPEHFQIRMSDRRLLSSFFPGMPADKLRAVGRLMDKRDKLEKQDFERQITEECGADGLARVNRFLALGIGDLATEPGLDPSAVQAALAVHGAFLSHPAAAAFVFDPGIVRGFDYYTGLIFEINDSDPENKRALFGGGRYDKLVGLFGKEDVAAVGFGMGDVTLETFLRSHDLVPEHLQTRNGCFLTLFDQSLQEETAALAAELRKNGIAVETALEPTKKFGRQLETAEKKGYHFALIMGREEIQKGIVRVKDLKTGQQNDVARSAIASMLLPPQNAG